MRVLLGESNSRRVRDVCERLGWGRMWVLRNILPVDGERWGFDCGTFAIWDRVGPMHPAQFDGDKYMRRVERAQRAGSPWLAVVPDLIAAGDASLEFSLAWRERMPREWPLYLAVQDGMRISTVDDWTNGLDGFAGVFMGGGNRFKAEAEEWCGWAHARGRRFHYARCSSPRLLMWCTSFGADSVDSSQPLWSWDRLEAFERAFVGAQQGELFT